MNKHLQKHRHHYAATLLLVLTAALSYSLIATKASAAAPRLVCDSFNNQALGNNTYRLHATVRNSGSQTYYPTDNRINGTYFDARLAVDGGSEYQYGVNMESTSGSNSSVPPGGTATEVTSNSLSLSAGATHTFSWRFQDVNFNTIITCSTSFSTPAPPAVQPASPPASTSGSSSAAPKQTVSVKSSNSTPKLSTSAAPATASVVPAPEDQPPVMPQNFTALPSETGSSVTLNWDSDVRADSYTLEQSTDNANWKTLSSNITENSYEDKTTKFDTPYYYRLTAVDSESRSSVPALAQTTTNTFQANAGNGKDLKLVSPDGVLQLTIPAKALKTPASCSFAVRPMLTLYAIKDYDQINDAYQLMCQQADNTLVTSFNSPLQATLTYNRAVGNKYAKYAFVGYDAATSHEWSQFSISKDAKPPVIHFELPATFTALSVYGQPKHTPFIVVLLRTVGILAVIAVAGFFGLRKLMQVRTLRHIEAINEDYWHKNNGV